MLSLTDKYEVLKDIGDGSFGSVTLAKVKGAGSSVARKGSVVAIKTMKKTFESFQPCLELREVIFLKQLPSHPHLVPALDIFLDPTTKKLHIAMEYMDGNLYQLMKSRDHKCLDTASVKSILYQILSGLEHIHANGFFHRDIKPENILVSTSAGPTSDPNAPFRRHSSMTPPSTPPAYAVKIADFGLARETHSKVPYTTYVSTRWYRAPEVLLRAGEYSAPVDIWAVGAMAVEVATLKPLFPGSNEVDQVWRVCEVMGSPGNWQVKSGRKIGGGEWKDGARLAQKLGFSFPKMTPQSIEQHYLPTSQWPASFSAFVTSCLLWDPKSRPTSVQALAHEYFIDAVDPLHIKPSPVSKVARGKQTDLFRQSREVLDTTQSQLQPPTLQSKPSWFRKSFTGASTLSNSPSSSNLVGEARVKLQHTTSTTAPAQVRPPNEKRSTWHAPTQPTGAPMLILPTIKPVSPISDTITAQAAMQPSREPSVYFDNATPNTARTDRRRTIMDEKSLKKLGRQLSGNNQQYENAAHAAALSSLNGQRDSRRITSPSGMKEPSSGIFSHLRKRVRRLSGRNQLPVSPPSDVESQYGCGPWISNRSSMIVDSSSSSLDTSHAEYREAQRETSSNQVCEMPLGMGFFGTPKHARQQLASPPPSVSSSVNGTKRNPIYPSQQSLSTMQDNPMNGSSPIANRSRRTIAKHYSARYETPDEEDERHLSVEVLGGPLTPRYTPEADMQQPWLTSVYSSGYNHSHRS